MDVVLLVLVAVGLYFLFVHATDVFDNIPGLTGPRGMYYDLLLCYFIFRKNQT